MHRVFVSLNTSDYAYFCKAETSVSGFFGKRNYEYVQCACSYVLHHHVLSHDSLWAKNNKSALLCMWRSVLNLATVLQAAIQKFCKCSRIVGKVMFGAFLYPVWKQLEWVSRGAGLIMSKNCKIQGKVYWA